MKYEPSDRKLIYKQFNFIVDKRCCKIETFWVIEFMESDKKETKE